MKIILLTGLIYIILLASLFTAMFILEIERVNEIIVKVVDFTESVLGGFGIFMLATTTAIFIAFPFYATIFIFIRMYADSISDIKKED